MTKPLVTVVITTYKRPEKIASAIDSVIGQTYGNIEIIVVDENPYGSAEHKETEKVCGEYTGVNYIKNARNLGGGLSRNIGIESATGSFVAFATRRVNILEAVFMVRKLLSREVKA